jgi:Holliday junction resolvase
MATTPEGRIKRKLDQMLKDEGIWFYSPQAGPFGVSGIPDRVAIVRGQFVGIECKADRTKKPTALQQKCMRDIERAGGKCFVAYDDETINVVRDYIRACDPQSQGAGAEPAEPGPGP